MKLTSEGGDGLSATNVPPRRDIDHIRALTSASARINEHLAVDEMLVELCRQAARLTGASSAVASIDADDGYGERTARWSAEDRAEDDLLALEGPGADLRPEEMRGRGWLVAPLLTREGRNLGAVQIARSPDHGGFSHRDEALLESLAHIASVAIDKARVYEMAAAQELAQFREEILAGISHDMQTPLATITGIVDMLVEGTLDEEEENALHRTLQRQNRNLRALVQQFLDFSRLESSRQLLLRPRPTDVVAVMEQAVELFAHDRELVIGADSDLPWAMADPERLQQVLVNLLSNATKYSDDRIRVVARRVGGEVAVDVIDQGRGIDEDELANLFRKFHRGTNSAGTDGTGLGLYVSRALVEAQGGTLTATSTPGWGCRFRIRLPAASRGERPS